jgi:hypothetical protein
MSTRKNIGAGFKILWYGVIDADGTFLGSTTTTPTAGNVTGSSLVRLDGARTMPIPIPSPDVETVSGDDEPMVSFEWSAEDLPNGQFEMAVQNLDFEALIQGTKVYTSGNFEMGVLDPKDRDSQGMCMLLTRRAKSWDDGEKGAKKWQSVFIPQCTIVPLGTSPEQRTFTPYQYNINLSRSDQLAWTTVNTTEHGTTALSELVINTTYPPYIQRWTGDGATVAYTLSIAPVTGGTFTVWINNVRQTVTTDYTVSGSTLTFVAAPASSAVIVALYEIDESNVQ